MKLTLVTLDNFEDYWIKVRSLVADACKRSCGKYEAPDIMKELMHGNMNLWVAEDEKIRSIAITANLQFPRIKVCKLICCTGTKMKDWLHLLKEIEIWAKKQGCEYMEPECRMGWGRVLEKFGYERGHILLGKQL